MPAVVSRENGCRSDDTQMMGKMNNGPASVSAKALTAIRIVIHHSKVSLRIAVEKDDAVCADAKAPMTQGRNQFGGKRVTSFAVVDQDEVIAGSLVLEKMDDAHELLDFLIVHVFAPLDIPFAGGLLGFTVNVNVAFWPSVKILWRGLVPSHYTENGNRNLIQQVNDQDQDDN